MGNCLRNIASVKILADFVGIRWDIDLTQANSPIYVINLIKIIFRNRVVEHEDGTYLGFDEKKVLKFLKVYGINSHPVLEANIFRIPNFEFGFRHIYAFKPSTMSVDTYIKKKLSFYKTIVWPKEIIRAVQKFEIIFR